MRSISIIVPVYYGEKYIANLIHQIECCRERLGTEDVIEVLFINDAPDVPVSQEWRSKSIKVIVTNLNHHLGIHGARVKGLKECSGEYVLFLDQDDKIKPEYFSSQLKVLEGNDAVICKAIHEKKPLYPNDSTFQNIISKEYMLGRWNHIVSPGQVLIRKKAIPDIWYENILKCNGSDDWFLWLCMISKKATFALNRETLYEHVIQGDNASGNIIEMIQSDKEIIDIVQDKRIFEGNDLRMLVDGLLKKSIEYMYNYNSMQKKLNVFEQWIKLKERNLRLLEYLFQSGWKTVAIYGCGILGEHLYEELKCDINVKYFIDRNANLIQKAIPIYRLQKGILPDVDIIIITIIDDAYEIERKIRSELHINTLVLIDWLMDRTKR